MLRRWFSAPRRSARKLSIENLERREVPAAFTPGNLVIVRIGTGAAALSGAAADVFLDEYAPTGGSPVQSIAMPIADNGANQILTMSGSSTSDGHLTRSTNGEFLVLTGYDAAPGTASVTATTSTVAPRVIGRVAANGTIDTTTTTTSFSATNIRSAATVDGTAFWTVGGNTGVVYQTLGGSGAGTIVSSNPTNNRTVGIFGGQLYVGSGSGTNTFRGVSTVGTGLPTTTGATQTRLPGLTDTSNPSTYPFFLADLDAGVPGVDTLYFADDAAGAFSKFSLVGSTWTSNGTVGVAADAYRGLTASVSGSTVTLYAIRKNNEFVTLTDSTGYNGAFSGTPTVLATAGTNTVFRGIAFAPVASGGGNQAPVNTLPATFNATEDNDLFLTGISVADPDAGTNNIQVTLSVPAGNKLLLRTDVTNGLVAGQITGNDSASVVIVAPLAAINATLADAQGLKFTPIANANGTVVLSMATDDLGNSGSGGPKTDSDNSNVVIAAVNDTPVVTADTFSVPGTATNGTSVGTVTANDVENDTLSWSITAGNTGGAFDINSSTGEITVLNAAALVNGPFSLTVQATDNGTPNQSGSATITVLTNSLPVTTDIPTQTRDEDGSDIVLNLADFVNDVETIDDNIVYSVELVTNPGLFQSVAITGTTLTLQLTPNESGSSDITVRFMDEAGAFVEEIFTVTVNPINDQPTLDGLTPLAVDEDASEQTVSLTGISTGAANELQGLTITATSSDPSVVPNPVVDYTSGSTGAIRFTPVANASGLVTITVRVEDTGGTPGVDFIEQTFQVMVNPINDAPTLDPLSPLTIDEDATEQTVNLTGISAGPSEGTQSVTVTATSSNLALIANPTVDFTGGSTGSIRFTPIANMNGSATITVRVEDTGGTPGVDFIERTFVVTVNSINDKPVLDATQKVALIAVPLGAVSPQGTLVSRLTANATDVESTGLGVAITNLTQLTNGIWEYGVDVSGTVTWNTIPTDVTPGSAFLLDSTNLIRFLPLAKFQGFAFVSYVAWDGSTGAAFDRVDSTTGSQFSAATETAVIAVGKTSPRIDADGYPLLSDVKEDTAKPKGDAVSILLGTLATDANPKTKLGIAITGLSGQANGTWQYATVGVKFVNVPAVSDAQALLLRPTDKLRFVPNANFNGRVTFNYRAWDQTTGAAGDLANTVGLTAFSDATETGAVLVTPVNDAPVLDLSASVMLPDQTGATTAGPITVNTMLTGAVSDVDTPVGNVGIAVVGVTGKGRWEYVVTGTPLPVGKPTAAKALLLGRLDQLQFVPDPGFVGTATLTYRAWDGTVGTAQSTTRITGTAFGTTIETLTVSYGNTSPNLTAPGTLTAVKEDNVKPVGDMVSKLLTGGNFTDVPVKFKGIAVTAVDNTNGKWQYALLPNRFVDIGTVSATSALLLSDANRIRFVPNANFAGTATITYLAWDRASGVAGDRLNPAGVGSIGATPQTATVTVTAVAEAPVLDISGAKTLADIANGNSAAILASDLLAGVATDGDGNTLGLSVVGATGPGTWAVSTDGGTSFTPIGTPSAKTPVTVASTSLVRFESTGPGTATLLYKAWDGTLVSTAIETLTVAIGNSAPAIAGTPTLTSVPEDTKSPRGDTVAAVFGTSITDADTGALKGVAVTSVVNTNGKWQYAITGSTFVDIAPVSPTSALLLPDTAKIRFVPNVDFSGTAIIGVRAWDRTAGVAGDRANTTTGLSAFGGSGVNATVTVVNKNDAPVLSVGTAPSLPDNPGVDPAGVTVTTLLNGAATDAETATGSLGIAVTALSVGGTWQFQRDGETTWNNIVKPTAAKPVFLTALDKVRFVPNGFVGRATLSFKAWDGVLTSRAVEIATVTVGNADPNLTTT